MNRHDILLLQQIRGYPAITVTLPTHRTTPQDQQDPVRVKNLVKQAVTWLLPEFSKLLLRYRVVRNIAWQWKSLT